MSFSSSGTGTIRKRAEEENVYDHTKDVRQDFLVQRKENTATDSTYVTYRNTFKKHCAERGVSEAVTGAKLLDYLVAMKEQKTPARRNKSIKGGRKQPKKQPVEGEGEVGGGERVQYALKTLKTATCAIVDMWTQQEGEDIEYNGELFRRGADHPRNAGVKQLLKTHRVRHHCAVIYIRTCHLCTCAALT